MTNAPTPAGMAEETVRAAFQHFMHYAEFPCSASAMREAINLALAAQPSAGAEDICQRLDAILIEEDRMHPIGCASWEEEARVAIDMAKDAIRTHPAPVHAASEPEGGAVAWACLTCNSPRAVDPCPKCGTALTKPADGWDWPRLPDIDLIRKLAREVGYAIGVHGTQERDLDLIAAPWVAEAVAPFDLAQHIATGLGGAVLDYKTQDKPCGRWSCNINADGWFKLIDLSVMSPALTKEAPAETTYLHAFDPERTDCDAPGDGGVARAFANVQAPAATGAGEALRNAKRLALQDADALERTAEDAEDNQWDDWGATMRQAAERIRILAALAPVAAEGGEKDKLRIAVEALEKILKTHRATLYPSEFDFVRQALSALGTVPTGGGEGA